MERALHIAIDGPVASGKSTIGRFLARALGFLYLDTGAMYRGVTAIALARAIDPDDEEALGALAAGVEFSFPTLSTADAVNPPLLADGVEITDLLRSPHVERAVSRVASYAAVRQALVTQQRRVAQQRSVVMVGRDIGTVVLPDADFKLFLTAGVEDRARRRNAERRLGGSDEPYSVTLEQLRRRDRQDTQRELSPLKPAEDAVVLDTTGKSMEEAAAAALALVRRHLEAVLAR